LGFAAGVERPEVDATVSSPQDLRISEYAGVIDVSIATAIETNVAGVVPTQIAVIDFDLAGGDVTGAVIASVSDAEVGEGAAGNASGGSEGKRVGVASEGVDRGGVGRRVGGRSAARDANGVRDGSRGIGGDIDGQSDGRITCIGGEHVGASAGADWLGAGPAGTGDSRRDQAGRNEFCHHDGCTVRCAGAGVGDR